MAKSAKRAKPTVVVEATEAAAGVASAIDKERRRLERQLAAALRKLATRVDQLVAAEESKSRKAIAKRRQQADDAAKAVAELTDKLALLAGTGVDAAVSAPAAAVKAVGAATARAAKPVAKAAESAAKTAGTAAKTASKTASKAAGGAAKAAGTAAKSAGSVAGTAAKTASKSASKAAGGAAKTAGTAAKTAGSAAKTASAATTRVAATTKRPKKPSGDAGTDGAA